MKYRQQLAFIISFLGLRILTFILYTFFRPAKPGAFTPYIVFLYAVFDVLITFFLYRYVREIKQQRLSLLAILVIVLTIISQLIIALYIPIGYNNTVFSLLIEILKGAVLFVIALQLIKNKAAQPIDKALKLVGWSFLVELGFKLFQPVVDIALYTESMHAYFFELIPIIPLAAMIVLYLSEWKTFNESSESSK